MSQVPLYKIVLIGGPSVGKTCLMNYASQGHFTNSAAPTVHASCIKKMCDIKGKKATLEIWDTAGQEKFRSISPLFFRDSRACVAVFDLTVSESMETANEYINDYLDCVEDGIVIVCGNKCDLVQDGEDSKEAEAGREFAENLGYQFFATSAVSGLNVDLLFDHIASILMESGKKDMEVKTEDLKVKNEKEKKCC